ncbi:hypothetical protein LB542_19630 [Mesorhizobium sp. BR1-1-9]|uniref:hypothetical protein n=1 Tax=Mesorhizobium sp. BR1-1-9 TaxID=2876646 RepID=UPI001CD0CEED|nr:hypothetical protein [Mesorhizobium sp. BR1-1-9]MBZ9873061.1 hypothetical protein [Mesorhizobium sp. BR1-1-9]
MTIVATAWLALSLVLCAFAWLAGKRLAILTLPASVILAAFAIYLPLGKPLPLAPAPGKYAVLGVRIDVDVAIWALLDDGKGIPVYYRLPYSTGQANALQGAKDAAGEGGRVSATIGEDGGVQYDGPSPVTGEPPKQAEQPAISIPG